MPARSQDAAQRACPRDAPLVTHCMHVVYVWPYVEWGGAQTYLLGIMKHARGRRLSAVIPRGSSPTLLAYLEGLGVPVELLASRLPVVPTRSLAGRVRTRWKLLTTTIDLFRTLARRARRDTVFHCDLAPWTFFTLLAYLSLRSQAVVTLHTGLPRVAAPRRWIWRAKFSLLCALPGFRMIAANRDMLQSLTPYLGLAARSRIVVAYSPVDADEVLAAIDPRADRRAPLVRLGLSADRFYAVTLAQFIDRKGRWVLLDAAREVTGAHPDVVFLWMAPEPMADADRARVEAAGLRDRFRFLTPADFGAARADLFRMLAAADLFVLPAFEEGLPLAIIEAMAVGTPVVASRINAIPEAIEDGTHGLLTPPGDAHALAQAIARLREDTPLRTRMGHACRARALREFDLVHTAGITLAEYDAVLAR